MGASNEKLFMFCESLRKIFFKTVFLNVCIKIYQPSDKIPDYRAFVLCRFLSHFVLHPGDFNL